tara:strand:- start:405 stop:518 length:114 start_codon:yes stop_codon:yes gene_type:complete
MAISQKFDQNKQMKRKLEKLGQKTSLGVNTLLRNDSL